jgi:hypothetical protein
MGISAYNANLNPQGQTVTVPTSLAGSTDPQNLRELLIIL